MKKHINKNPNINKENIINRIKLNERRYMTFFVILFLVVLYLFVISVGTDLDSNNMNTYDSGLIETNYNSIDDKISNVVTLNSEQLTSNNSFTIKNNSHKNIKYRITLVPDDDFIELDGCRGRIFKNEDISFKVNDHETYTLNQIFNYTYYILEESIISGKEEKEYTINFTVNKINYNIDNHFHGLIRVDEVN